MVAGSRTAARRRAQAGAIGLTDALLGVAVTAMVLPTMVSLTNQQTRETQDQVAAQQLKAVGEATRVYVRDHFAALYNGIYQGSLAGDFLQIADLAGSGYLPANFAVQNAYKQSFVVLLRIVADTSPSCPSPDFSQLPDGVNCKALIEAVVVTTGGTVLDPVHASHVGVLAGAGGGIVADNGTVRGSYGSWCEDLTLFGGITASATCPHDPRPSRSNALASAAYTFARPAQGGVSLGLFFNGSDLMSEYLNRFNTGNPEDNTMHTGVDMGGHGLTNVSTVQIAGVDQGIAGSDQGLEATRMNMINNLFNGTYAANDGKLTATQLSAQSFWYTSDARLKTNVKPLDHALDRLLAVRGVSYDWRDGGQHDVGVVAQNVQQVFPELVGTAADGTLRVKYGNFVGPLIEGLRELSARNKTLEDKLARLTATEGEAGQAVEERR